MINLEIMFERYSCDFLDFESVIDPLHRRPDICGLMLLDKLAPEIGDIIIASTYDEIYLKTDLNKLANIATETDIITLIRCGVRLDRDKDCLYMYV